MRVVVVDVGGVWLMRDATCGSGWVWNVFGGVRRCLGDVLRGVSRVFRFHIHGMVARGERRW